MSQVVKEPTMTGLLTACVRDCFSPCPNLLLQTLSLATGGSDAFLDILLLGHFSAFSTDIPLAMT